MMVMLVIPDVIIEKDPSIELCIARVVSSRVPLCQIIHHLIGN